jgi:hypothetical protein
MVLLVTVIGAAFAIPTLIALNLYMLLGMVFKNMAIFQGLVWWEVAGVILLDIVAIILLLSIVSALLWWNCGGDPVGGAISGTVIDWLSGTNLCASIK